jgi:PBP1b-binding outer membrane lipoprotein LpoB
MKKRTGLVFAGAFFLVGCESWQAPYISDDRACDEIVDARERLDCHQQADEAEDKWREEKRRETKDKAE